MLKELALTVPGGTEIGGVAGMPEGGINTVEHIIQWGTTMLMIVSVFLAIFFLIWGGITWITSAGDKEKIESARKKILYSIIGLTVIFASFLIINIVGGVFGVDFFE